MPGEFNTSTPIKKADPTDYNSDYTIHPTSLSLFSNISVTTTVNNNSQTEVPLGKNDVIELDKDVELVEICSLVFCATLIDEELSEGTPIDRSTQTLLKGVIFKPCVHSQTDMHELSQMCLNLNLQNIFYDECVMVLDNINSKVTQTCYIL